MFMTESLNADAQAWADLQASQGTGSHSHLAGIGENIAMYWSGTSHVERWVRQSLADASVMWYDEVKNYDFDSPRSNDISSVGHFTQMVWDESTELGVGWAIGECDDYDGCKYSAFINFCPASKICHF